MRKIFTLQKDILKDIKVIDHYGFMAQYPEPGFPQNQFIFQRLKLMAYI